MSTASSGNRVRAALLACLAALFSVPAVAAFEAVAAPPASAGGPTVLGSGSSYAAVALDQWTSQASALYGDNINYQTSSSVIGLNDYAQGQLNFGASEIGYSTKQAAVEPSPPYAPYQYLPDVAGATCLMYNLQGSTGQTITNLQLSEPVLLNIFTGQIQNWNDPQIANLNPGVPLPATPITKAFRSDASGENYIFSDYFAILSGAAWNAFTTAMGTPPGAQAIFPQPSNGQGGQHGIYNISGFQGQNGSDVASQYVSSNLNSITYVETAYAIEHNKPCAAILNPGGAFVKPSAAADAIALTQDQLAPDLEQDLTQVFLYQNPQSYPISAYSYLITQVTPNPQSAAIGAELGQFVQFIACLGQQAAASLGYSPIPPNLVSDDFAAVNRLNGAAQLSTPTAANCPNPYLIGSIKVPGISSVAPPVTATSGAAIAGTGSGAGGGSGSGGSGSGGSGANTTTTTNAAASQAAIQAEAAAAAAKASKVSTQLKTHAAANGTQIPGLALTAAAGHLLGLPGPSGEILVWSLLLVLAFVGVPIIIVLVKRQRMPGPGSQTEKMQ